MEENEGIESQEAMWEVCRKLPSDFVPYGERPREEGPDCSEGCRYFVPLAGRLAFDWGVCGNPKSPRAGLLTFEHQGCPKYEPDASSMTEEESAGEVDFHGQKIEKQLRKLPIDPGDFETAFDGFFGDEASAYLNKKTGEVAILFSEMEGEEEEAEIRERIEEEWDDWIEIEPIESRTGYQIMERFASSVKRAHVRKLLFDALSGRRPFRRFKDVLEENEELRQAWFKFEDDAKKQIAADWLALHGIEPEWVVPKLREQDET